jgi:hypothetical protein
MPPFIPFLCIGSLCSSGAILWWYDLLSPANKKKADDHARNLALSFFNKAVDQLTPTQLSSVMTRVRKFIG